MKRTKLFVLRLRRHALWLIAGRNAVDLAWNRWEANGGNAKYYAMDDMKFSFGWMRRSTTRLIRYYSGNAVFGRKFLN